MNHAHARKLPLALALPLLALAACGSSGGSGEPGDQSLPPQGPVSIGWQAPGSDPQAPRSDPQAPRSDPQAPGGSGQGPGGEPGGGGSPVSCSSVCDRVPLRCVADCQDTCSVLESGELDAIGCGGPARALVLCVSAAGLTCDEDGSTDLPEGTCEEAGKAVRDCVQAALPELPSGQGDAGTTAQQGQ